MVRRLIQIVQDLCDDCAFNGIPDVPAFTEHIVAIDGGRPRRIQLCTRCDKAWKPFLTIYEQQGQDVVDPAKPAKRTSKSKPKAVKAAQPKELEAAPATKEPAPKKPTEAKKRLLVKCPLPHSSIGGVPKEVAYTDRGTHADMVHDHAKMWDIVWEDPYKILKHACDAHAECIKTGLSFTTERGLAQHRSACQLPRIDQGQEGGPQKSDEQPDT
jgi:hypothetical protein